MFGLNISMQIQSHLDFPKLREHLSKWKYRYTMFRKDVQEIESAIEKHIQNYSKHQVSYKQTHKNYYVEQAQKEIDEINRIIGLVEKLEVMAMLSKR